MMSWNNVIYYFYDMLERSNPTRFHSSLNRVCRLLHSQRFLVNVFGFSCITQPRETLFDFTRHNCRINLLSSKNTCYFLSCNCQKFHSFVWFKLILVPEKSKNTRLFVASNSTPNLPWIRRKINQIIGSPFFKVIPLISIEFNP